MSEIDWLERTELLIGEQDLKKLKEANVLIVGLGGVGSFAAEFIARSGVGRMTIVDGDAFDPTNKNRQLPALDSTIDHSKADVMGDRIRDINPDIELTVLKEFVSPERAFELVSQDFDCALDCIDSITPKLNLMIAAKRKKVRMISSMGAGGKIDPSKVKVSDISKTYNCKMAKQLKKRLKKENIDKGIRAVFSAEPQIAESLKMTNGQNFKKSFYGTISYMPAIFGLYAAADAIRYIREIKSNS